ncbi:saccharopine dehydrogenase family protein [Microscilla marina]|uniref:Saccharopine dehydrogenase n=1 Tax=Microscilla marina ATCC 23134 TaxID=313606 RepID=A1ZHF5_MICM2|nr:saccharopine dehydrogenase NADP-binding domain-containing protein [Microscilla marina]EAY30424.1 saccharopine dehydrogenase [Microscilla marina ATCC 23134]
MHKAYDIVLWGATGFTGQLVAQYLLHQYGTGQALAWAIAGRNESKLKKIRTELGNENIPMIIADSHDRASLEAMVQQTKVVCTTVGPYAKYGDLLVELCVTQGVHYCDLTGEIQWMRRTIDQHHQQAQVNQTKIVHCCGVDSIPSDMGVYFLQKQAQKQWQAYAKEVKLRLTEVSGGVSGGTVASLDNVMEEAKKDPQVQAVLDNPYSLNPVGQQQGNDQLELTETTYDDDFKAWIAPFVMAAINARVVRRSHALNGFPYGEDFRYDEATFTGEGITGWAKAQLTSVVSNALFDPTSFLKKLINPFLPDPGKGPSEKQRENGYYKMVLRGESADGKVLKVLVHGDRDPGYGSTSKMLAESAVCLAKDELPASYGVLTPHTAMGEALLQRLEKNAGVKFSLLED